MIVGGRWGWVAGPVAIEPVYAPALVVFIGGGAVAWAAMWDGFRWARAKFMCPRTASAGPI